MADDGNKPTLVPPGDGEKHKTSTNITSLLVEPVMDVLEEGLRQLDMLYERDSARQVELLAEVLRASQAIEANPKADPVLSLNLSSGERSPHTLNAVVALKEQLDEHAHNHEEGVRPTPSGMQQAIIAQLRKEVSKIAEERGITQQVQAKLSKPLESGLKPRQR